MSGLTYPLLPEWADLVERAEADRQERESDEVTEHERRGATLISKRARTRTEVIAMRAKVILP